MDCNAQEAVNADAKGETATATTTNGEVARARQQADPLQTEAGVHSLYSSRNQKIKQLREQRQALNQDSVKSAPLTRPEELECDAGAEAATVDTRAAGADSGNNGSQVQVTQPQRRANGLHMSGVVRAPIAPPPPDDNSSAWWPRRALLSFACCTSSGRRGGIL